MGKSVKKSAADRGQFEKGYDPRRGHGPAKGALNAGRPPDEFKAQMAALASRDETLLALETILSDPNHSSFIQALRFATDRGYGRPAPTIDDDKKVTVYLEGCLADFSKPNPE